MGDTIAGGTGDGVVLGHVQLTGNVDGVAAALGVGDFHGGLASQQDRVAFGHVQLLGLATAPVRVDDDENASVSLCVLVASFQDLTDDVRLGVCGVAGDGHGEPLRDDILLVRLDVGDGDGGFGRDGGGDVVAIGEGICRVCGIIVQVCSIQDMAIGNDVVAGDVPQLGVVRVLVHVDVRGSGVGEAGQTGCEAGIRALSKQGGVLGLDDDTVGGEYAVGGDHQGIVREQSRRTHSEQNGLDREIEQSTHALVLKR